MDNKSLIIIITYNSGGFIESCLESIVSQSYKNWDLLVIDNNSSDDTIKKIREFRNQAAWLDGQGIKLTRLKKNIGFAGAVNRAVFKIADAAGQGTYKYLILLNPDISLFPDALERLVYTFGSPGIGAAGGLILEYDRDIVQHKSGKMTGNFITYHEGAGEEYKGTEAGNKNTIVESDYVTGAFFATPYSLFKDSGGFDRGYRPLYFEELDYCLRLREAGWRVVSNLGAACRHFEGASVKKFSSRFYRHYHKNRLRCAILNMDMPDLLRIFIPAEIRWLKKEATRDQKVPLLYAYFINSLFFAYNLVLKIKNHFILNRIELK